MAKRTLNGIDEQSLPYLPSKWQQFQSSSNIWEVLSKPELHIFRLNRTRVSNSLLVWWKDSFFIEHICLGDDAKYFWTQPRATVLWLNLSFFHTQLLPGDTRLYFDICYKKKLFHDIIPCINGDDTHENTL